MSSGNTACCDDSYRKSLESWDFIEIFFTNASYYFLCDSPHWQKLSAPSSRALTTEQQLGKEMWPYFLLAPAFHDLAVGVRAVEEGQAPGPSGQQPAKPLRGLLQPRGLRRELPLGQGPLAQHVPQAALAPQGALLPLLPVRPQGLHLGRQQLAPAGRRAALRAGGQRLHSAQAARAALPGLYQLLQGNIAMVTLRAATASAAAGRAVASRPHRAAPAQGGSSGPRGAVRLRRTAGGRMQRKLRRQKECAGCTVGKQLS